MQLLKFARSAIDKKPTRPPPPPPHAAHAPSPFTGTDTSTTSTSAARPGIVLLDANDLTRYDTDNFVYDMAASINDHDDSLDHSDDFNASRLHETPMLSIGSTSSREDEDDIDHDHHNNPSTSRGDHDAYPFHHTLTPMIAGATTARTKLSMTSIDVLTLSQGALRLGGAVDLVSNLYIGFLLNWVVLGFLSGGMETLVAPFFAKYCRMRGYQLSSKLAQLDTVFVVKIVLAFVCDAYPIQRQRRKPYMYIGFGVVTAFMAMMVCMHGVDPFISNKQAPTQGARYLVPLVLATVGHLLATVASEGMLVEFAHREGEYTRGKTQCIVAMFRYWGEFLGRLFVAVATNGAEYGGNYGGSLPIQAVFAIFAVAAVMGLACTRLLLVEDAHSQPCKAQIHRAWSIANLRPAWQLMVFGFLCKCATSLDVLERSQIYSVWLRGTALTVSISMGVRAMGGMLAAALVCKLWINSNWRVTVLLSMAIGVVVALPVELITTFDAWRALAFYLTKDQIVGACDAMIALVLELVIVEIAEPGYEATTFACITTVYNLARPVMAVATSVSVTPFNLRADTTRVQWHVAKQQLAKTLARIVLIVAASRLLPRQKRHAKELKAYGSARPFACFCFGGVFVLVLVSRILALVESTSCLTFAGGAGCM